MAKKSVVYPRPIMRPSIIEQENTVRALKEQPLIALRSWYCYFKFHRWTRWTDPVKSNSSIYVKQYRRCVACNIEQKKEFRE